jgi:hypothetical protein
MEADTTKKIVFAGGTGKAGRHAAPHPVAKDYSVLNLDLMPLDLRGTNTLIESPLWDEVNEGELVTYVACLAANNALKDGDTFTAGDLGVFTVKNKANVFSEPLVFTNDAIDQYQF